MYYRTTFILVLSIIFLSFVNIHAQEIDILSKKYSIPNPPINVETSIGHSGLSYQLMVNKKLASLPKLGFFSITSLISNWERSPYEGIMTQGLITYRLFKGWDMVGGFHYTNMTDMRPSLGVIYSYAQAQWLLVANPRVDLAENAVSETMIFVEYKPRLTEKWNVYTRVQALYGLSISSGAHARSYLLGRLGLTYKEYSFGLAINHDWFGPHKGEQANYGAFLSLSLFN